MSKHEFLRIDFADIYIYDNYLISVIDEGVILEPSFMKTFLKIIDKYYKNKDFIYIANRVNSYSINPAIYKECSKIENLKGFCIVSNEPEKKSSYNVEKLFYNKLFVHFRKMDEAVKWANKIIRYTPN
jgi:hypothetical protein